MKKLVMLFFVLATTLAHAGNNDCKIKLFRSEFIKDHYSKNIPRILKDKKFTVDNLNPEFEIRYDVSCWGGGCSRPIGDPDILSFKVKRISDGEILQFEESTRVSPGSRAWYPNRIEMMKELISCKKLRKL